MAMTKLIYSDSFDKTVGVGMQIVEDPALVKTASATVFGCDYDALKADKDHVGIHLTGVGAHEFYGLNRNFDGFLKRACVNYHHTFVDNGALFRHHRNKDRNNNLGLIKASAYNPEMGRIELFIHANKERARDELHQLEKHGEASFSMACKVAFDRCTICDGIRKNASDPNQCEHIRDAFGKTYDDGRVVGTYNDEPQFFDISFVGRPADRIAWSLKVAAGETLSSVKLAEAEGVWLPDHLAIESASGRSKARHLQKIAEMQDTYYGWFSGQRSMTTPTDYYFFELRKAANADVDDATLTALRVLTPTDAFTKLAEAGVVLTVEQFLKYATGPEYKHVAPHTAAIAAAVPYVITDAVKQASVQELCAITTYDAALGDNRRCVNDAVAVKLADASIVGRAAEERAIIRTIFNGFGKIAVDRTQKICVNTHELAELAKKYAAYQLSAVDAIVSLHDDTDVDTVCAIAAAQNVLE